MNLGWISLYLFFSLEMNDIQHVFFHMVKEGNFITLCDEIQGVFFIYLWGMNFRWQMDEFYGVFLSVYGIWISDNRWVNFMVCFLSVYRVWISDNRCYDFSYFVLFTYVFSLFLEVSHGTASLTHFSLTHIADRTGTPPPMENTIFPFSNNISTCSFISDSLGTPPHISAHIKPASALSNAPCTMGNGRTM